MNLVKGSGRAIWGRRVFWLLEGKGKLDEIIYASSDSEASLGWYCRYHYGLVLMNQYKSSVTVCSLSLPSALRYYYLNSPSPKKYTISIAELFALMISIRLSQCIIISWVRK